MIENGLGRIRAHYVDIVSVKTLNAPRIEFLGIDPRGLTRSIDKSVDVHRP
jgi:hypothetical protein